MRAVRYQVSDSGNDGCFISLSKRQDWLWGLHSELVATYWRSLQIKRHTRQPNNSPVSSAEVMMHSTILPLLLSFQLNEQQKLKSVRVSGTEMYGKFWAGCSLDWYSPVGEGECLPVPHVNFLQLEVLDCLNCEGGDSKLQRKLIIKLSWSFIRRDINV